MLRMLVCGIAVLALGTSLLQARPGVVKTKDGTIYEGDVTEKGDTVEIAGVAGKPGAVGLNRGNIEEIVYPDAVADEVRAQLKKMDPKDVALRLKIARLAFAKRAYVAAREALQDAARIDPGNKEVSEFLITVTRLIPPPATMPATNPTVATTNPVKEAPKPPPGAFIAKRMVTPLEMNRIRQLDWHIDKLDLQSEEAKRLIVAIDSETRKSFQASSDLKPAEINKLSALDLATRILTQRPDLSNGVLIKTDPPAVAEFKKVPRTIITRSCGSAGCHGGPKAGNFRLFPGSNDAATYTNYLTLRQYSVRVKGTERSLVDREPEYSLLLQFLLQPDVAEVPHPNIPGVSGAQGTIRAKTDPKYQQILSWITSLSPVVTQYGIDLNADEQPGPRKDKK